jgi:hypothetical protein
MLHCGLKRTYGVCFPLNASIPSEKIMYNNLYNFSNLFQCIPLIGTPKKTWIRKTEVQSIVYRTHNTWTSLHALQLREKTSSGTIRSACVTFALQGQYFLIPQYSVKETVKCQFLLWVLCAKCSKCTHDGEKPSVCQNAVSP